MMPTKISANQSVLDAGFHLGSRIYGILFQLREKPLDQNKKKTQLNRGICADCATVLAVIFADGARSGQFCFLRRPDDWWMGHVSRAFVASCRIDGVEDGMDVKHKFGMGSDDFLAR